MLNPVSGKLDTLSVSLRPRNGLCQIPLKHSPTVPPLPTFWGSAGAFPPPSLNGVFRLNGDPAAGRRLTALCTLPSFPLCKAFLRIFPPPLCPRFPRAFPTFQPPPPMVFFCLSLEFWSFTLMMSWNTPALLACILLPFPFLKPPPVSKPFYPGLGACGSTSPRTSHVFALWPPFSDPILRTPFAFAACLIRPLFPFKTTGIYLLRFCFLDRLPL